jgi:hypothetical protein
LLIDLLCHHTLAVMRYTEPASEISRSMV